MLGHVKYISNGHPGSKSEFEDRDILMGERIEDGYKVFYISDNRIALKKKYKRLTRKSIEAFLNMARELRDAKEHVIDKKSSLTLKGLLPPSSGMPEQRQYILLTANLILTCL